MNAGRILAAVALLVGATTVATAQTATQTVTFAVNAINKVAVSGNTSLTVSNVTTVGNEPDPVSSAGLTWAVTTNAPVATAQKVTAQLTAGSGGNMPAGLTLSATLAAPATGTSDGAQTLSTTAVRLINGLSKVAQSGMALTITLSATVAAGTVASTSRDILYTITTGP